MTDTQEAPIKRYEAELMIDKKMRDIEQSRDSRFVTNEMFRYEMDKLGSRMDGKMDKVITKVEGIEDTKKQKEKSDKAIFLLMITTALSMLSSVIVPVILRAMGVK